MCHFSNQIKKRSNKLLQLDKIVNIQLDKYGCQNIEQIRYQGFMSVRNQIEGDKSCVL